MKILTFVISFFILFFINIPLKIINVHFELFNDLTLKSLLDPRLKVYIISLIDLMGAKGSQVIGKF